MADLPKLVAPCLTRGWLFCGTVSVHAGSKHVTDFAKTHLVHVEHHSEIGSALVCEKLVKKWRRDWKLALIGANNPAWHDLWEQ